MTAKLVLAMFVSLDGYTEGPNGAFVPPPWSEEVAAVWAQRNIAAAGHLLYGRVNFEFNKAFWTSAAAAGHLGTARMNELPKTVVSRTLSGNPGWNATVAAEDLAATIARLKARELAGDIYSFGGAGLARSLMLSGLVDEYHLMVTPVMLGGGKRLFDAGLPGVELRLLESRALDTGAVVLRYGRR